MSCSPTATTASIVSTDRIIDELWDGTGQDRQNALWVVISRLRGLLEPDRPPSRSSPRS